MILQEVGFLSDEGASDLERVYRDIFTSTEPAMYAYSARVARHLMKGDGIAGLLYPSIASGNGSHNLALKANFVDCSMRMANVSLYRVTNLESPMQYYSEEIDFAVPGVDGGLDWKGRKRQWVLRKQGEVFDVVSTGWSWDVYDQSGGLVDPE